MITTFTVRATDGRERAAILAHPGGSGPAPLVLCPAPMGFSAADTIFGSPAGERTALEFPGIWPSARERGAAVVSLDPVGANGVAPSLGWPAHLDAYAAAIEHVRALAPIDDARIVACGISMGGLESLLLAGRLAPVVRAVAVQNSLVDLVALHDVADVETRGLVETELGGSPLRQPSRYRERGAARYLAELARIPVHMRLNEVDRLVVASTQGQALARDLAAAGGRVEVHQDLPDIPAGMDASRVAHEHINWPALLDFVLVERRRGG